MKGRAAQLELMKAQRMIAIPRIIVILMLDRRLGC